MVKLTWSVSGYMAIATTTGLAPTIRKASTSRTSWSSTPAAEYRDHLQLRPVVVELCNRAWISLETFTFANNQWQGKAIGTARQLKIWQG
jgi:hypothetical protein